MRRSLLTVAGAIALAALVPAQTEFDWRVPLHRPVERAEHWWAGGADYKVRFDAGGVTFFPRLGPTRENLPFAMKFGGVWVGDESVASAAPAVRAADWRFEFDRGVVTEVYDVRDEGVEQRFVFARRPAHDGALRVVVELETELTAEPASAAAALDFVDAHGAPVLRYGAAVAFDASGARTDVTTHHTRGRIELEVPADFVAAATFPLTIDPLVHATAIYSSGVDSVDSIAIASDLNESGLTKVCSVVSRIFSGSDSDVFGFVTPVDYVTLSPVYLDFDPVFESAEVSVAYVGGGTPQFVVTHQRVNVNTGQSFVTVYAHDRASLSVNSGQSGSVPLVATENAWRPQVGGTRTGTRAMIVFDHESSGGSHTVRGCRIDLSPLVVNIPFLIGGATTSDVRRPSVNPLTSGATSWRVVFVEVEAAQSVLQGAEVSYAGTLVSTQALRTLNVPPAEAPILPKIAGEAERYLCTVVQRNAGSVRLVGRRLDWPDASSRIVRYTKTIVNNGLDDLHNGGVAYDYRSLSHWSVAYSSDTVGGSQARVERLGFTGASVESRDLHPNAADEGGPTAVCVAIDRPVANTVFEVLHAQQAGGTPVTGQQLEYSSDAIVLQTQSSCSQGAVVSGDRPFAGDQFYTRQISGLPANAVAAVAIGRAPDTIDLSPIGMSGCIYGLDPAQLIYTFPRSANAAGTAQMVFPLLDDPLFLGNLWYQWMWIDLGANVLGVVTHHPSEHRVR